MQPLLNAGPCTLAAFEATIRFTTDYLRSSAAAAAAAAALHALGIILDHLPRTSHAACGDTARRMPFPPSPVPV